MQVYEMARFYNAKFPAFAIPQNILDKAPSAELAPGQTDEASLLPYPVLDTIVEGYVEHFVGDFKVFENYCFGAQHYACAGKDVKLCEWFAKPTADQDYDRMIRLINNNEFKRRQAAPGIKITPIAFGIGRRLPIVKG
jgi:NH3-dependent NAD+ synthetase